ncbi:hypothetical protein IPL85_00450 [Candidatus Saccharibacteria bacterium]|nr:MAG: hypothetical protein IPL85_00450 [Candidatus Saccharibacteria bacterium]
MAYDTDADGFLGVTFISHDSDHTKTNTTERPADAKPTSKKPPSKHSHVDSDEIQALQEEIERLEITLQTYELETEERLQHLERMAGHPITAEEKVFRIQEES